MKTSHPLKAACHAMLVAAMLLPTFVDARAVVDARGVAMTHVIELFTSQGCSSCPPADRLLATLARNPNTVALSFPVDYWDYIGWKDIFASPVFTARQQAYARLSADGRVYTPQAVIDGVKAEVGSDKAAIDRAMSAPTQAGGAMSVPMSIEESGGYLRVDVGAGQPAGAGVYVLRVVESRTVEIGRGENSGRSVTYTNVVRAMNKIGDWNGQPAHFDMLELKADGEGYVVLLQAGDPGKPAVILSAAKTPGL
jgi:hypothetical protein